MVTKIRALSALMLITLCFTLALAQKAQRVKPQVPAQATESQIDAVVHAQALNAQVLVPATQAQIDAAVNVQATDAQASEAATLLNKLKNRQEITYPTDVVVGKLLNRAIADTFAIRRIRPNGTVSVEMNSAIDEVARFLDLQCSFVTVYDGARNGVFIGEGALKLKLLQSVLIVYDDNTQIPSYTIQIEIAGNTRQFGLNSSYVRQRSTSAEVSSWTTDVSRFDPRPDKTAYSEFNDLIQRGIDYDIVDSWLNDIGVKRDLFPVGGPVYSAIWFRYSGGFDTIRDNAGNLIKLQEGGSRLRFVLLQSGTDVK